MTSPAPRPGVGGVGGEPAAAHAPMPAWRWALRLSWLALQIILVLWFGQKGVQFVYQGF